MWIVDWYRRHRSIKILEQQYRADMFYFYKSHLYPTELPRKYNERIVAHLKQDYPNVNDFERAFWYIASGDWKYAKTYYFK